VSASVTCPLDQFEPNNHLPPTTITITGEPPPPPTPVTPHASQHEDGAADEIIIDGLHGRAADPQTALDHRAEHQAGGGDELNVGGLRGTLADGQPIADHHTEHEDGGGDELNVTGLYGVLANKQPPQVHDNTEHDPNYAVSPHNNASHDPNYATETALANHLADTTAVHAVATNLEQIANKGDPNGYAGLGANGLVPAAQLAPTPGPPPTDSVLRADQTWGVGAPGPHKAAHENGGGDEVSIAGLSGKAADAQDPVGHHVSHEPGGTDVLAGIAPLAHKTSHQDGGSDELSITGLSGLAADAQTPAAHKAAHENGGGDEVSIAGLSGEAADPQPPKSHGNADHTSTFEDQANKNAASGYCPLDGDSLVPVANLPEGVVGAFTVLDTIDIPQAGGDILHVVLPSNLNPGDHITANVSGLLTLATTPVNLAVNFDIFLPGADHLLFCISQGGLTVDGIYSWNATLRIAINGLLAQRTAIGSSFLLYEGPASYIRAKSDAAVQNIDSGFGWHIQVQATGTGSTAFSITNAQLRLERAT